MGNKRIYNLVLSLFFVIIFSVPVYWIARGPVQPQQSLIEGRNLSIYPKLSFQNFKTAVKRIVQLKLDEASTLFFNQGEIQKAAADQFPFRISAIQFAKAIDRGMIDISYTFLSDQVIPADMHSGLFITRDGTRLMYPPALYDKSTIEIINKRIENYNNLIRNNPDIKFYLFYLQTILDSTYHPLNSYFKFSDKGQALAYFEAHQPVGLTVRTMILNSYNDFVQEFYATDHHWNIYGIRIAYNGVYDMLAKDNPEISPRLNLNNVITFPGISFLGSLARSSLYPMSGDKFQVFKVDLPPYQIIQNGKITSYTKMDDYLAGNYSTEPYINHYGAYYGSQPQLLDFDFENGATRNLLIIGSSYARPIVPLIASHYHHTYYIDLRQNKDFSLSKFLNQYHVDTVLILGENVVAFAATTWMIQP